MEQFTQGAWVLGTGTASGCILPLEGRVHSTPEGPITHPIARFDMGWDEKEDQANGRLLVKAKAMYEQLRKVQEDFNDARNFPSDGDLLEYLKKSIDEIEPLLQEVLGEPST
jgi:hypothetical protein